jgi:glycosyltransferase involved in cell wall biosynthesis
MDREILSTRSWDMNLIDWRRTHDPVLFFRSRARHWAYRKLTGMWGLTRLSPVATLSRVGPELLAATRQVSADIYIAHNLGALPIACAVGKAHGAKVGFDAEDFHSGQLSRPEEARAASFTRAVERRFLPQCTYVTAAAPGIAEAYRALCGIPLPTCILNVFPLNDRPARFRPCAAGAPVRLHWFSQTIGPTRGLEDAVRAIGLLKEHSVELHLRGRWQAGYERQLRQLADACGVEQRRLVSHPPAPPEQLVRLSSEYDVGLALEWPVSTNHDILLSNKIFTYLLAGNAVIVSRTSGQLAIAPQLGVAASLCEPQNPASLATALKTWLEHPGTLTIARETAWRLAEERFNWDYEKAKFLDVVDRALGVDSTAASARRVDNALSTGATNALSDVAGARSR